MAGLTERASRGALCAVGLLGRWAKSLPPFAAGKGDIAVEWPGWLARRGGWDFTLKANASVRGAVAVSGRGRAGTLPHCYVAEEKGVIELGLFEEGEHCFSYRSEGHHAGKEPENVWPGIR